MSVDYQVMVPSANWPTFEAMNAALARQGFPVFLLEAADVPDERVRETPNTLGLPVILAGTEVELEAGCFIHTSRSIAKVETNAVLAELGSERRLEEGDVEFSIALRSRPEEWIAGSYIMAVLVREFDGYGYETQSNTHGQTDWANDLVESARQGFV